MRNSIIIITALLFLISFSFSCSKEKTSADKPAPKYIENYASDSVKSEKDLIGHLKKLSYWAYYYSNNGIDTTISPSDSLERENKSFQAGLLDYTSANPETISNSFQDFVKAGLILATSDDGLFRIYSWDTQTGGTMHFYDNIYKYKSGDKVYSITGKRDTIEGGDPRSWYSEIYTLVNNGKKYYLGLENSEYSTKDLSQSIKFFTINNNSLNDTVSLLKTGSKKMNTVGINYNFFSVEDHPERPLKLIVYDEKNKTISVPVVDDKLKVTKKYDVYRFNGEYFEPEK